MRGDLDENDAHVDLLAQAQQHDPVYHESNEERQGKSNTADRESKDAKAEQHGHREDNEKVDHNLGHKFDQEHIRKAQDKRNEQTDSYLSRILRDIHLIRSGDVSLLIDEVRPSGEEGAKDDEEDHHTTYVVAGAIGNRLGSPLRALGVVLLLVGFVAGQQAFIAVL